MQCCSTSASSASASECGDHRGRAIALLANSMAAFSSVSSTTCHEARKRLPNRCVTNSKLCKTPADSLGLAEGVSYSTSVEHTPVPTLCTPLLTLEKQDIIDGAYSYLNILCFPCTFQTQTLSCSRPPENDDYEYLRHAR